jgi:glycosyltransferase involved in cell wall biosynthesis
MIPKVSVIIPAYNYAKYTVETVNSVLQQTYQDYEIIVVNDGSTDDTEIRLQPFIEKKQIKYIYQENKGASNARNTGIKNACGEYLAFLDCDDLYLPQKLELSVACLKKNPSVGLVYTPLLFIDELGRVLHKDKDPCYSGMVFDKLILKVFIRNSTCVIRKQCFDKVGLFDESLFYPADWDMWLRISESFPVDYISLPLSKYRYREKDYFVKNTEKAKLEMVRVAQKMFSNNPKLPEKLKLKVLGQISFLTAVAYLKKMDLKKAKDELLESRQFYPENRKAKIMKLFVDTTGPLANFIYYMGLRLRRF